MSKSFHGKVLDRIKTFSDAVFSIVITILILELKAPVSSAIKDEDKNKVLGEKLLEKWPEYVSLAASFILVGSFWKTHALILRGIEKTERILLYINTMFLAFISLIPMASSIFAKFSQETVSAAIFNLLNFIIGILLLVLFLETNFKGRLKHKDHKVSIIGLVSGTLRISFGPLTHALGFGIAFVNTYASIAIAVIHPLLDIVLALNWSFVSGILKRIYKLCCKRVRQKQQQKKA